MFVRCRVIFHTYLSSKCVSLKWLVIWLVPAVTINTLGAVAVFRKIEPGDNEDVISVILSANTVSLAVTPLAVVVIWVVWVFMRWRSTASLGKLEQNA